MELFKRYMAASSMGVVALVCVLVGLLGVTVLRPPTHQVSSVESATDLIMTRGNVLSIVKDDVTVTATSKSGAPVTLSIGTTQDVKGWIGDAAYTEVIGDESPLVRLPPQLLPRLPSRALSPVSSRVPSLSPIRLPPTWWRSWPRPICGSSRPAVREPSPWTWRTFLPVVPLWLPPRPVRVTSR